MSQNLAEFLKVLTIVLTWSICLTVGRYYILSIDEADDEPESLVDDIEEEEVI